MKWITTLVSYLFIIGCEKIVFVEVPIDNLPYVTSSIVSSSTKYQNGIPFVTAGGKIKNHGPGTIKNVRILVATNYGSSKMSFCSPSQLEEGGIGSWSVTRIEGTFIKNRSVLFN